MAPRPRRSATVRRNIFTMDSEYLGGIVISAPQTSARRRADIPLLYASRLQHLHIWPRSNARTRVSCALYGINRCSCQDRGTPVLGPNAAFDLLLSDPIIRDPSGWRSKAACLVGTQKPESCGLRLVDRSISQSNSAYAADTRTPRCFSQGRSIADTFISCRVISSWQPILLNIGGPVDGPLGGGIEEG